MTAIQHDKLNDMILQVAQKLILKYGYQKVTMTDIAAACQISRTTLYKSYPNKESVIVGLIDEALEICVCETNDIYQGKDSFKSKLGKFFDVWTIRPAASVIDLETGRDILLNVASYAPEAVENHYLVFEKMLATLIKNEMKKAKKKEISVEDLAHILTIASKGLKASTENIGDLKKLIKGLIAMTLALVD